MHINWYKLILIGTQNSMPFYLDSKRSYLNLSVFSTYNVKLVPSLQTQSFSIILEPLATFQKGTKGQFSK